MIVRVSTEAEGDLEAIGDFIARDNPDRALSFLRELRDAFCTLGEMPERFPLIPRYESLGIRRRLHGNYGIFYRVDPAQVMVIHVLHGARDYEAILTVPE